MTANEKLSHSEVIVKHARGFSLLYAPIILVVTAGLILTTPELSSTPLSAQPERGSLEQQIEDMAEKQKTLHRKIEHLEEQLQKMSKNLETRENGILEIKAGGILMRAGRFRWQFQSDGNLTFYENDEHKGTVTHISPSP